MSYPGGKNGSGTYQAIINLMPPHDRYIEPFLGGGAIMRLKRPARLNIGIDLDPASPGLAWVADIVGKSDASGNIDGSSEGRRQAPSFLAMVDDALAFLKRETFTANDLVYLDPPYLASTRTKKKMYACEFGTELQHRRLLRWAIATPARVMLSCYWSDLYAEAFVLNGQCERWQFITINDQTRAGRRESTLWFNFPIPDALHDYRFLGKGFREREKITRQQKRWSAKLRKMDRLQRQALLAAIAGHAVSGDGDVR